MDSTQGEAMISGGGEQAGERSRPEPEADSGRHFGIDVLCWSSRWRVLLSGQMGAAGASTLVDIAEVLAARGATAVDLDLSEVTAMARPGWRAVTYAETLLSTAGADCRVISPPAGLAHPARTANRSVSHAA